MGKKKIRTLFIMVFLVLAFAACGDSKEDKEKAKIREIAQKYFDALRIDDQEGVYDCYLPGEREKRDAELGLVGLASRALLKVDISEVLLGLNTLFGGENEFASYKYKALDVDLDEDGTDAIAYVGVYKEKEWMGNVRIDMMKYDGNWYVIKGTIADDDRVSDEGAGVDGGEGKVQGETGAESAGRTWLFVGIAVFFAAAVVFLLLIFRSRGGRKKKAGAEFANFGTPAGGMASSDIMCSCGTVNPAGIRTCMGCGKKLKRRR